MASGGRGLAETWARAAWVRWLRPRLGGPLTRQRVKLLYFGWAYWRVFFLKGLRPVDRLRLLGRALRVDWSVSHAHRPGEVVELWRCLASRPATPGEVAVEAGCWQGGSTAKLSILCKSLGYRLLVFDSFEGVEAGTGQADYDYSGEYAAAEELVRRHVAAFGEVDVCEFHKGWFSETLAARPVSDPVRLAYIDCDLAKGTVEAMRGVLPALAEDGVVFTQDYHIRPVREVLHDPATWDSLNRPLPQITPLCGSLAALRFAPSGGISSAAVRTGREPERPASGTQAPLLRERG